METEIHTTAGSPQLKKTEHETTPFQPSYRDVIVVGLGTQGLAVAAALADQEPNKNTLILERNVSFNAELNYASSESAVATSFLHDLIAHRNPRSEYTFTNFLHSHNLLVDFLNASQLAPSRLLMERYTTWVAAKIGNLGWVSYGTEATRIRPSKISASGRIEGWQVECRHAKDKSTTRVYTKRLILAAGNTTRFPEALSNLKLSSQVIPLDQSADLLEKHRRSDSEPLNIAILGADQEAVELFHTLQTTPGTHRASLIFPTPALKPDSNVPFADEPIHAATATYPPELRRNFLQARSQAPGITLSTLEAVYTAQYAQSIYHSSASTRRFLILPNTRLLRAAPHSRSKISLTTQTTGHPSSSTSSYDLVVVAKEAGPSRAEGLLQDLRLAAEGLLPPGGLQVDRGYEVDFRRGLLGAGCAVWVLGTLGDKALVRRDDFGGLAEMAGRVVEGVGRRGVEGREEVEGGLERVAML